MAPPRKQSRAPEGMAPLLTSASKSIPASQEPETIPKATIKVVGGLGIPNPSPSRDDIKIMCLNTNGLRSAMGKGLGNFLAAEAPDIFCVSETKIVVAGFAKHSGNLVVRDAVTGEPQFFPGYSHFFSCATAREGYASTAVFLRDSSAESKGLQCLSIKEGIGADRFDSEGRVITAEFQDFFLVHAYVPNSGRGGQNTGFTRGSRAAKPASLPMRGDYETLILSRVSELQKTKPVVYCGDLNVAHQEIDIHDPEGNQNSPGFTDEERGWMGTLLSRTGLVDTFRSMHPEQATYSWFSNMGSARATRRGWRIDYFLANRSLADRVRDSLIRDDKVTFSDHVPIVLLLKPT